MHVQLASVRRDVITLACRALHLSIDELRLVFSRSHGVYLAPSKRICWVFQLALPIQIKGGPAKLTRDG
jgi:hypothetical protein